MDTTEGGQPLSDPSRSSLTPRLKRALCVLHSAPRTRNGFAMLPVSTSPLRQREPVMLFTRLSCSVNWRPAPHRPARVRLSLGGQTPTVAISKPLSIPVFNFIGRSKAWPQKVRSMRALREASSGPSPAGRTQRSPTPSRWITRNVGLRMRRCTLRAQARQFTNGAGISDPRTRIPDQTPGINHGRTKCV